MVHCVGDKVAVLFLFYCSFARLAGALVGLVIIVVGCLTDFLRFLRFGLFLRRELCLRRNDCGLVDVVAGRSGLFYLRNLFFEWNLL